VGLMERAEMGGEGVSTWGWCEWVYRVSGGWEGVRRGWYVKSPHILAGSFRVNKNGRRGSPGAKMESVVRVRRQEPKA
jgi:hypothetical protein